MGGEDLAAAPLSLFFLQAQAIAAPSMRLLIEAAARKARKCDAVVRMAWLLFLRGRGKGGERRERNLPPGSRGEIIFRLAFHK